MEGTGSEDSASAAAEPPPPAFLPPAVAAPAAPAAAVAVDPDVHGSGWGTALMEHVLQKVGVRGSH